MIAPQKVPVKISTSSVSLRARRHAGYQESDNRWLCLVYLKGAGRLILHDQVTSKSHDINITAGQLIAFPKIRFKHEYASVSNRKLLISRDKNEFQNGLLCFQVQKILHEISAQAASII